MSERNIKKHTMWVPKYGNWNEITKRRIVIECKQIDKQKRIKQGGEEWKKTQLINECNIIGLHLARENYIEHEQKGNKKKWSNELKQKKVKHQLTEKLPKMFIA